LFVEQLAASVVSWIYLATLEMIDKKFLITIVAIIDIA